MDLARAIRHVSTPPRIRKILADHDVASLGDLPEVPLRQILVRERNHFAKCLHCLMRPN